MSRRTHASKRVIEIWIAWKELYQSGTKINVYDFADKFENGKHEDFIRDAYILYCADQTHKLDFLECLARTDEIQTSKLWKVLK
jgi:hypothetical protein